MKKLLKINPQYPISIGLIIMFIGGVFFDITDDLGFGITLLGSFITIKGAVIGFIQRNKRI